MKRTATNLFRGPAPKVLILAMSGALLLAGCARDTDDLQAYISQTKARPAPPLPSFEEPEQAPTHRYPSGLERDPFNRMSFVERQTSEDVVSGPRPDSNRPREALEEYPLDALRMVGLLERQGERWALVRDPHGTVHRVKEGNYLGQNHGRVVDISEQNLKLVELVRTGERSWTERNAALATRDR